MPVDLWTSEPFLDDATAWVAAHAARHGLRLTGERDQPHARPWSSAISFETDGGRLWFKVNGPGTAHEAALVGTLGRVVPDLVPEVLATDARRGWSLMRDAGPVMRSLAEPEQLWERWETVLTAYAEAQRTLTPYLPEILAEGVPVETPEELPTLARQLTERLAATPVDRGGLTRAETAEIEALLPTYDAWCAELAASEIPATINHDDLHSSNVCWADRPRLIDWGDAVVSHPFTTLLGTLNSIAWHAKRERTDPQVLRLRDTYLEVYADHGSAADRERWTLLARRTGCIGKALAYVHAFEGEPWQAEAEEDWPVRGWLLELREAATWE